MKNLTTEEALLPCPFCGKEPMLETYQTLVSIRCDPCGVTRAFRGPLSGARTEPLHTGSTQCRFTHPDEDYDRQTIADAKAAWNSRATLSAPAVPSEAVTLKQAAPNPDVVKAIEDAINHGNGFFKITHIPFAELHAAAPAAVEEIPVSVRALADNLLLAVDNLGYAEGGLEGMDHLQASANNLRRALKSIKGA